MNLYIPDIGDEFRLAADWTFELYNESRNLSLMEKVGDVRKVTWGGGNYGAIPCTIPAGTTLKVDRIYIRKGMSEYSSLSFLWVGERTEPRVEQRHGTAYFETKKDFSYEIKIPRKPIRFWAKLADVNKIEYKRV